MELESTFIDKNFSACVRELNRAVRGPEYATVVKVAVGRVLKTCIRYTPAASIKKLRGRTARRLASNAKLTRGDITVNTGTKDPSKFGRVHVYTGTKFTNNNGKKSRNYQLVLSEGFKKPGAHLTDAKWGQVRKALVDFRSDLRTQLPKTKMSRGGMKNSWVQSLYGLRVDVAKIPPVGMKIPGFVKDARASNGHIYVNGRIEVKNAQQEVLITVVNTYPYQSKPDMGKILQGAIRTTVKGIETDVTKGVFEDVKTLEKRWPVFINST